ncbi:hypothetical protein JCM1841_000465 [Sporobolomyces salmonicolor]
MRIPSSALPLPPAPTPAIAADSSSPRLSLWQEVLKDDIKHLLEPAEPRAGMSQRKTGYGVFYQGAEPFPQWPAYPPAEGDSPDGGGAELPTQMPRDPRGGQDQTLALLIPLIIVLTVLLFLIFLLIVLLLRRKRGIVLPDEGGPTNLEREEDVDGEGGLEGVESRWLQSVEEATRIGYQRAKLWQTQYPPNSQPTEITLSQFLSIQEKGVSAWSFEPDYESNPALIVQSRTEITFLADGFGMTPEEGGGCCVQSNLPLPKLNEVYYWEAKMYEKPGETNVAIGLSTKPYPSFRLPGWNRYSIGYHSADGFKSHSFPFTSTSYGPPLHEGDTLGVGYRPRTGTVFFTRNGKKLDDAFIGFNKYNLFPTVGADGACSVHVNLGQAGFVFIEANVKKWGLAPMMGTLAPPPAYGSERGSILLESAATGPSTTAAPSGGRRSGSSRQHPHSHHHSTSRSHRSSHPRRAESLPTTAAGAASALASPTQPIRPSPLRHSRQASTLSSASTSSDARRASPDGAGRSSSNGDADDDEDIHNPPTPGLLDISLHSIHRFPERLAESDEEEEEGQRRQSDESGESGTEDEQEQERQRLMVPSSRGGGAADAVSTRSVSPPAYNAIDPNMYAPGVAETILEDVLATAAGAGVPSSSSHSHLSSRHASSFPLVDPRQASFLAQFALHRQTQAAAAAAAASGSSSPGYEGRQGDPVGGGAGGTSGRGGMGNRTGGGGEGERGGSGGIGGWLGWLSGRGAGEAEPGGQPGQVLPR